MAIIFFSGVGAVGKTSVIDEFKNDDNFRVMPSITRSVYAKLGIESEEAALNSSIDTKLLLQQTIFFTYIDTVRKLAKSSVSENLIIDRSPIDHWSYFMSKYKPTILNDENYVKKYRKLVYLKEVATLAFFEELKFNYEDILVVKFPFPNPWNTKDTTSSDGFRSDAYSSNLNWEKDLADSLSNCRSKLSFNLDVLVLKSGLATPTDRYKEILGYLERNL